MHTRLMGPRDSVLLLVGVLSEAGKLRSDSGVWARKEMSVWAK